MTNQQIFDETTNLAQFWQHGGTWSMDQYVSFLLEWEKQNPQEVARINEGLI